MKSKYQKLLKVALSTVFCLACMFTKQMIAMNPQQQINQARQRIQQINQQLQPINQRMRQINQQRRLTNQQLRLTNQQLQAVIKELQTPPVEPIHTMKQKMYREQLQQKGIRLANTVLQLQARITQLQLQQPIMQQQDLWRQRSLQQLLLKDLLERQQQQ